MRRTRDTGVVSSDTTPAHAELAERLLGELRSRANAENVAGMARFGINSVGTLGVSMPEVRRLARDAKRELGRDPRAHHDLAAALWTSGVHEARIMAALVDAPALVTLEQADAWVLDLDSWDTCDQLCLHLLRKTGFAWDLPPRGVPRAATFVRRAGLVVCATLAVHERNAEDARFDPFIALAEGAAFDARNDVKKGSSWALRQIGKRSAHGEEKALAACERILESVPARGGSPDEAAARWVARDVTRELVRVRAQRRGA
jgi:3-methyladenine DNA glycosylase AlkD